MRHYLSLGVWAIATLLLLLSALATAAAQSGVQDPKEGSSSNALAEAALKSKTIEEKEKAAVDLATSTAPDATEALLQVLEKSKDAEVLVGVIDGLGDRAGFKKDVKARDCMPTLVKILEDEKGGLMGDDDAKCKRVRARACLAIVRITGADYGWDIEKEQTEEQRLKLKETLETAKFYIAHPPPGGGK